MDILDLKLPREFSLISSYSGLLSYLDSAQSRNKRFLKAFLRNNRLPFAVGQVGHSFRNEISTGNGLIRTREFQMAEIEHFFDPLDDDFEEFQPEMKNLVIPIWTENAQLSGQTLLAIPISDIDMVRDQRTTTFDDPSIIVV